MAQNRPEPELVSCGWHGQLAGWWEAVIVRVDDGEFPGKGSILRFVKIESPEREPEAEPSIMTRRRSSGKKHPRQSHWKF